MLDMLLSAPIQSDRSRFSIRLKLDSAGDSHAHSPALPCRPAAAFARSSCCGDPGLVRLDPALASDGAAFREARVSRHRSTASSTCCFSLCLVIPLRRFIPLAAVGDVVHWSRTRSR